MLADELDIDSAAGVVRAPSASKQASLLAPGAKRASGVDRERDPRSNRIGIELLSH